MVGNVEQSTSSESSTSDSGAGTITGRDGKTYYKKVLENGTIEFYDNKEFEGNPEKPSIVLGIQS